MQSSKSAVCLCGNNIPNFQSKTRAVYIFCSIKSTLLKRHKRFERDSFLVTDKTDEDNRNWLKRTFIMPLPFTPQKEIPYNSLLPYKDRLDDDSNVLLSEIKYNLGRAVVFKELTPGVLIWCNRLTMYVC